MNDNSKCANCPFSHVYGPVCFNCDCKPKHEKPVNKPVNKPIFENEEEADNYHFEIVLASVNRRKQAKIYTKVAKEKGYIKQSELEKLRNRIEEIKRFNTTLNTDLLYSYIDELEKDREKLLQKIKRLKSEI
jgi:predicted transcriptional regulator